MKKAENVKTENMRTGNMRMVNRNPRRAKAVCAVSGEGMLSGEEGLFWLDSAASGPLIAGGLATCVNTAWGSYEELLSRFPTEIFTCEGTNKKRINLLALGDVGSTVLIGLKLLGGEAIEEIGIFDVNPHVCQRWEYEMNQTINPLDGQGMPPVRMLSEAELFHCDVLVFCASAAVPPVGAEGEDLRMVQFNANRKIAAHYGQLARKAGFSGLFAVVSDPIDPLCREVFLESNRGADGEFDCGGLLPEQIQGYGLGVMNGRGVYYAKKESRFETFLTEGRAFGPHGKDLVLANSIDHYDDELSKELTKLAAEANLKMRELGFKPYVAPALSSAAIAILLTITGKWHYSSVFLGGVYMGCNNRFGKEGLETESLPLPKKLYERLLHAYEELDAIR